MSAQTPPSSERPLHNSELYLQNVTDRAVTLGRGQFAVLPAHSGVPVLLLLHGESD
jgi:hypothetical protein